jgi:hypothetical protein
MAGWQDGRMAGFPPDSKGTSPKEEARATASHGNTVGRINIEKPKQSSIRLLLNIVKYYEIF